MADIITLTDKARSYLINLLNKNNKQYVLLQAKGGGCAGFKYDWSFPDEIDKQDTFVKLNENKSLVIDRYSAFKLMYMNIDYVESISGLV